jgi:hypothetical protein
MNVECILITFPIIFRYKVLSVKKLANKGEVEVLQNLQTKVSNVDFWNEPGLTRNTQIMVLPSQVSRVESYLEQNGFQYNVSIPNVQGY